METTLAPNSSRTDPEDIGTEPFGNEEKDPRNGDLLTATTTISLQDAVVPFVFIITVSMV
jgi:hypothetical protein